MVKLTLAGKIVIGIIALAFLCILFSLITGFIAAGSEKPLGKKLVKVFAFVKTLDENSARLNKVLAELKNDPELKDIFSYEIIVVDVEKEKAAKFAIQEEDVPCFILGNQLISGVPEKNWLKTKILEIAKRLKTEEK